MGTRGPRPLDEKSHVVAMLRLGEFSSLAEAAMLAGVTPQRVGQWAKAEGIDWRARRDLRLRGLWIMHLRRVRRRRKSKRQSKADLRAETERLVAAFNRKRRPVSPV